MENTKQNESFTPQEWRRREAESYLDYLSVMTELELIEEYHRQGGEDRVCYDKGEGVLVVNYVRCDKCGSRMVSNTTLSPMGRRDSDSWCPECGWFVEESVNSGGIGTAHDGRLSPEQFASRKRDRQQRIARDGRHWRAIHDEFMKELGSLSAVQVPSPPTAVQKAHLIDRLRAAGVSTLAVDYDGCGDSGCVEDITACGPDGSGVQLPADLLGSVEEFVYDRLPDGWEIDDGGFGSIKFDVAAGTVAFDHAKRYTEHRSWHWEE